MAKKVYTFPSCIDEGLNKLSLVIFVSKPLFVLFVLHVIRHRQIISTHAFVADPTLSSSIDKMASYISASIKSVLQICAFFPTFPYFMPPSTLALPFMSPYPIPYSTRPASIRSEPIVNRNHPKCYSTNKRRQTK